jgi:hypothetical protein
MDEYEYWCPMCGPVVHRYKTTDGDEIETSPAKSARLIERVAHEGGDTLVCTCDRCHVIFHIFTDTQNPGDEVDIGIMPNADSRTITHPLPRDPSTSPHGPRTTKEDKFFKPTFGDGGPDYP